MINFEQEHHQMVHTGMEHDGAEELYCPICGRRIAVNWSPEFKKTVIDPGDENAIHSAGTGGVSLGAPEVSEQETPGEEIEQARLADWEGWLTAMNFAQLWR